MFLIQRTQDVYIWYFAIYAIFYAYGNNDFKTELDFSVPNGHFKNAVCCEPTFRRYNASGACNV